MKQILKNRIERIELAIKRGYTANLENGICYNRFGKEVTSLNPNGYLCIHMRLVNKYITIMQHQFIYYLLTGEVVDVIDHIDRNKLNNKKDNLRSITHQKNVYNTDKGKGYSFDKRYQKWQAYIKVNGKKLHLGYFNLEDEHLARQAFLDAKQKYHII